jgi:hypothetical protein
MATYSTRDDTRDTLDRIEPVGVPQRQEEAKSARLLRRLLQLDAIFVAIAGSLTAIFSLPLASFLGLSSPIALIVLGIALLPYAAQLFFNANRKPLNPRLGFIAGSLNIAWAAVSLLIVFAGRPALTDQGKWAVLGMAAVVDLLGCAQLYAAAKLRREPAAQTE